MTIIKECENCTTEFKRIASQKRVPRFCSKKCVGESTAKQRGWDGIRRDKQSKIKVEKISRRTVRYKNRYGITEEDYNQMYILQKGLCAICNNPPKVGQRLYIDHNHTTKKVRALLCQACNSMIGYAKESIKNLSNAIAYLDKYNKESD